jgi:uncharacterized membrane protein YkvA (DUF1232 family)
MPQSAFTTEIPKKRIINPGENKMSGRLDILQNQDRGFIQDLIVRVKLILRLMGDKRVNFLVKLLPIGALIYLISPIDLIPGAIIPVIGALDDAAVLWLGATLFINLCPEEVVQEHMKALQNVVSGTWREPPPQDDTGEIIEVEAHEIPKDNKW